MATIVCTSVQCGLNVTSFLESIQRVSDCYWVRLFTLVRTSRRPLQEGKLQLFQRWRQHIQPDRPWLAAHPGVKITKQQERHATVFVTCNNAKAQATQPEVS